MCQLHVRLSIAVTPTPTLDPLPLIQFPPPYPDLPLPLQREFGFKLEARGILVDDLRVRASGRHIELPEAGEVPGDAGGVRSGGAGGGAAQLVLAWLIRSLLPCPPEGRSVPQVDTGRLLSTGLCIACCLALADPLPTPAATSSAYFEQGGRQPTPAYLLSDLKPGHAVQGALPPACRPGAAARSQANAAASA